MIPIKPASHKFSYVVQLRDLPAELHKAITHYGLHNEYEVVDYHDGDYHLLVNFSLLQKDVTPPETVALFLEHFDGEDDDLAEIYGEDKYPFPDWEKVLFLFGYYLQWVQVLQLLAKELPPEFVKDNTVAIWVSQ